MDWQKYIADRTTSPEEAVRRIKSGDRVVVAHAASAPFGVVDALMERAAELRDVEVVHMVAMAECPYCDEKYEGSFRFNGFYVSGGSRKAVVEGRGDFTPMFFSRVPDMFRRDDFPVDAVLLTVSPPDDQGRVSLGVSIDYTRQAVFSAKTSIAVINPNMPYVGGEALIDAKEMDLFIHSDAPLPELALPNIGPVEQAIGENVASLVRNGDCLQLGIGAIPDAVLHALNDKKDLGIHSEMISDGVMNLVEKGVINCSRKNTHTGRIVITFAMGSPTFYRWLDKNPMVEGYPVDYVNDPRVIGQNDNVVAINSALSVDLLGQVAADAVGPKQFSGVGGQADFVRGSQFSKGGFNIIAMPSTAAKGTVSRLVGSFEPGQAVTTTRNDVNYIVTEHGIAELWGKTNAQRAKALIAIAAPEYREELARAARDLYCLKI